MHELFSHFIFVPNSMNEIQWIELLEIWNSRHKKLWSFFLKSLAISLIAVVYVHTDGPTSSVHSCTHKYSSSLWPCYSYKFFVFPVFSMLLFSLLPKGKSQKVIYTKVILHQLMIRLTMYLLVTVSRAVRWITSCYLTVIYVHFCSIADRKLKLLES